MDAVVAKVIAAGQRLDPDSLFAPRGASEPRPSVAELEELQVLLADATERGAFMMEHVLRGDDALREEHTQALRALTSSSTEETLGHASLRGYDAIARSCLAAGVSPNARYRGIPVLCLAADKGRTRVAAALLEAGADASVSCSQRGFTALMYASNFNRLDIVRLLVAAGAPLGACCRHAGRTALHFASLEGHARVVEELCAAGASTAARDGNERTPLHSASAAGKTEAALALLRLGADAGALDTLRQTPLQVCLSEGQMDAFSALLPASLAHLRSADAQGATVLHHAAAVGSEDAVALLLPHFAVDVDVGTAPSPLKQGHSQTALHVTCGMGLHGAARALLKAGASRAARDSQMQTPLHACASRGSLSCAILLLGRPGRYRMDAEAIDARNVAGCSALHLAADLGHFRLVGVLIAAGARLDSAMPDGTTPLGIALEAGLGADARLVSLLDGTATAHFPGTVCDHCCRLEAESGHSLRTCTGCFSVVYCGSGASCQRDAWAAHKAECRALKAAREAAMSVIYV